MTAVYRLCFLKEPQYDYVCTILIQWQKDVWWDFSVKPIYGQPTKVCWL